MHTRYCSILLKICNRILTCTHSCICACVHTYVSMFTKPHIRTWVCSQSRTYVRAVHRNENHRQQEVMKTTKTHTGIQALAHTPRFSPITYTLSHARIRASSFSQYTHTRCVRTYSQTLRHAHTYIRTHTHTHSLSLCNSHAHTYTHTLTRTQQYQPHPPKYDSAISWSP